jgi:hypothetical protein
MILIFPHQFSYCPCIASIRQYRSS